jgi:ATP-dependent Clp protease ATP-binding subunit ClpA
VIVASIELVVCVGHVRSGDHVTDDRARKKAVRRRMAQTGEKYTEARRALENAATDPETEGAQPEDPAWRGQFGRFTDSARRAIALARKEARALEHDGVGSEHILLGLLREEDGIAARVLASLDITVDRVHASLVRSAGSGDGVAAGELYFTAGAKQALELALREALSLGHNYIGTEHILLGLAREDEGTAARVLLTFGADLDKLHNEVVRNLAGSGGGRAVSLAAESPRRSSHMLEHLSPRARDAIDWARLEARALGHDHIADAHILLGLLREPEGLAGRALEACGVTHERARGRVRERIPGGEPTLVGRRPLTPRAKRIVERALREALARGHNRIGTEHILLGLICESEGAAHAPSCWTSTRIRSRSATRSSAGCRRNSDLYAAMR